MKELFNDYVQTLETYIMFLIKQETLRLTPELTAKGRKPITLAMGAPVKIPPAFVTEKLIEAVKTDVTPPSSTILDSRFIKEFPLFKSTTVFV